MELTYRLWRALISPACFFLFAAAVLLVLAGGPAWPADAAPPDAILDALRPYLLEVIGTLIAALLAWVGAALQRWTGQKIDEKHMLALQSALSNAAMLVLERGMAEGVAYVRHSVPDAVKAKQLDAEGIARVLEPKVIAARTALAVRPKP